MISLMTHQSKRQASTSITLKQQSISANPYKKLGVQWSKTDRTETQPKTRLFSISSVTGF